MTFQFCARLLHKTTEGSEVPDFWINLEGSKRHEHFNPTCSLPYTQPQLYSVGIVKQLCSFTQLPPSMKKGDLASNACYFLVHDHQVKDLICVG